VDGPELFSFDECGALGYNTGLLFKDLDGDNFRGVYGRWHGGGFDGVTQCVALDANCPLSNAGCKFSDTAMVSTAGAGVGGGFICNDDSSGLGMAFLRPMFMLSNVSLHGTFSRAFWLKSTSRANVVWDNGYVEGNTDELALNQSTAGGTIDLDKVGSRVGAARCHSTIWNGIKDRNGRVIDPSTPANTTKYGSVHRTGLNANVSSTNIYQDSGGTPPAGQAVATLTVNVTTAGAAGTVSLNVIDSDGTSAGACTQNAAATGHAHALRGMIFDGVNPPTYTVTGVTAGCVYEVSIDMTPS
jgi:hypothetical protein